LLRAERLLEGYDQDNARSPHHHPDNKRIRAILGGYYRSFKIKDVNDWYYRTIPGCTSADDLTSSVCVASVGPIAGSTQNERPPAQFGRGFR
jgi:hypothetical protein